MMPQEVQDQRESGLPVLLYLVKSTSILATYMWDEVQEGVAAQRAHSQRHQEAEQELEENSVHQRDEHDAQQGQQADHCDGDEPPDPC